MSREEDLFKCATCSKLFENKQKLSCHKTKQHPKELFTCPTCGKQFKRKLILDRHILIHTGEQPFACSTCNKRFNQKHRLTEHERIHSGEKPYLCPTCAQRFAYRQTFVEHLRDHAGIKHNCPVCQQEFVYLKHLHRHIKNHADEKHFLCSVCTKEFNEMSDFLNHMKIHSKDKQHECQMCHKQFKTINVLQKHINDCLKMNQIQLCYVAEIKNKKYRCYSCKKDFLEKDEYDEHVRNHVEERARNRLKANKERYIGKTFVICDICELRCPGKNHLRVHLMTHSGVKPIKCSLCCERFGRNYSLKRHKEVVHGIKPPKCSYIFHEGRHLLVYNGKKPSKQSKSNEGSHQKEIRSREPISGDAQSHDQPSKSSISNSSRRLKEVRGCEPTSNPFQSIRNAVRDNAKSHEKVQFYAPSKIDLSLKSFSLGESASLEIESIPFARESSPLEREFSPSEREYSALERESSPIGIISLTIPPEIETQESKQDLKKYNWSKELKLVLHKLTKDEIVKHTSKEQKDYKKDQNVHLPEQEKKGLSDKRTFSMETESSSSESELLLSEIKFITSEKKTLDSERDLNKFDHLINRLKRKISTVVPQKAKKDETEEQTSKRRKGHMKRPQEVIPFSVERETSPLETESFPSEIEIISLDSETQESEKDLNKYEHLINTLRRKDLNIVPHKLAKDETENQISKEHNGHMKRNQEVLPFSVKREPSPLEKESFPSEIETISLDSETEESEKDLNKYDYLISKLRRNDLNIVPHKLAKEETEKHHMKRHQEILTFSVKREPSPLEKESFPSEIETISLDSETQESEKDLNKYDHLINKLRRKDLNIVSHKVTEKHISKENADETEKDKPENQPEDVFSGDTKTEEAENDSGDNSSYLLIILMSFLSVCLMKSLTKKRI